jgi:hypothetical protein
MSVCSRALCVVRGVTWALRACVRTFSSLCSYMSDQTPPPLGGDEPAPPGGDLAPDGRVTPGQGAGLHRKCIYHEISDSLTAKKKVEHLIRHRAERERRMVTETVRAGTGASTPALPRSRGGGDLFGSMGLGYIPLSSGASVGIMNAALVHENDLPSHRAERDRRDGEQFWYPLLSLNLTASSVPFPVVWYRRLVSLHGLGLHPPVL